MERDIGPAVLDRESEPGVCLLWAGEEHTGESARLNPMEAATLAIELLSFVHGSGAPFAFGAGIMLDESDELTRAMREQAGR